MPEAESGGILTSCETSDTVFYPEFADSFNCGMCRRYLANGVIISRTDENCLYNAGINHTIL